MAKLFRLFPILDADGKPTGEEQKLYLAAKGFGLAAPGAKKGDAAKWTTDPAEAQTGDREYFADMAGQLEYD